MREAPWTEVPDSEASSSWDRDLFTLADWTLDQSHAWGEHSRRLGWQVRRFVARDGDAPRAMAQVLVRSPAPGVRMLWTPGGPVGDLAAWGSGLRRAVTRAIPGVAHYWRMFSHRAVGDDDARALAALGWRRVRTKLRSGMSMRLDLAGGADALAAGLSSNWRHNLKRSGRHGLTARRWERPAIGEILAVYHAMETHKALREQFSTRQMASLFEAFGDRLMVWRCDDVSGGLLALRGCVALGNRAWDMLAAATPEARKVYASFATCWELLQACQRLGVRSYDLRGVEPEKNPGVYDFKKGTGAEFVEYLGEWDWATNGLLRLAADRAVSRQRAGD
ncbi:MAG: peptidoglycan bridge formation glycyltransferase FemA/FemB family protein [Candidatus Eisenbacteria bacterium]|uniref:Peptidoglycan bridge formation glycyltransferase FemA/FemB family protein n=1 Tax=Eiseniibacteriota bacterium TaxID=2212470 RepID=A0A9D6QMT1_UNCEI|nr:peptidoglycan bridge formation glycyltransferase FemA/FemB family protein [Candidatus Eisenbacteria bacterium]MBI3540083.1 peptidoglycan bridge formation glycyltransferase FemA/FemB family protein [Candidatus Eisenbacteria bacterium]